MIIPQRDKLRITTYGKKRVGFFRNGEKIKDEYYPIPAPAKMFDDIKEWSSVENQTTKYLK